MKTWEALNDRIDTLGQDSFGVMNGILHPAGKYVGNERMRICPTVERANADRCLSCCVRIMHR